MSETTHEWLIPIAWLWGIASTWCRKHGHAVAVAVALYAVLWLGWVLLGPSVRRRMDDEYWVITQISSLTAMYVALLLAAGHLTWWAVFKVLAWWEHRG